MVKAEDQRFPSAVDSVDVHPTQRRELQDPIGFPLAVRGFDVDYQLTKEAHLGLEAGDLLSNT